MPADPLYVIEKLWIGLDALASSNEDIRKRLANVFKSSLVVLTARDFPEDLREEFEAIKRDLTWLPVEYEGQGTVHSTTATMSDEDAARLASRIVTHFYHIVNRKPVRA